MANARRSLAVMPDQNDADERIDAMAKDGRSDLQFFL
jgi:hypothetical protein